MAACLISVLELTIDRWMVFKETGLTIVCDYESGLVLKIGLESNAFLL